MVWEGTVAHDASILNCSGTCVEIVDVFHVTLDCSTDQVGLVAPEMGPRPRLLLRVGTRQRVGGLGQGDSESVW